MLASFGGDLSAVVVGASGAIGGALAAQLAQAPEIKRLWLFSRSESPAMDVPGVHVERGSIDVSDEQSIQAAAEQVPKGQALVIVATGMLHTLPGQPPPETSAAADDLLDTSAQASSAQAIAAQATAAECARPIQPEKTWRSLSKSSFEQVFETNTIGPALVAKHFLPRLRRDNKSVFAVLSARVGSIGDNRLGGWHAYRSSKAALNMLVKNFSIELRKRNRNAICLALHPGTVDSALSAPFQRNVPVHQLFSPERAARQLLKVVNGATTELSGSQLAWDGQRVAD